MSSSRAPELIGLVLAGGESRRMGADKGTLEYRGCAHVVHLYELLGRYCRRVLVSVSQIQAGRDPYDRLPVLLDGQPRRGPATGMLVAHQSEPSAAWFVVAVDLASIDGPTLEALIAARNPTAIASAFEHPDGTIEPLCTIWEPAGLALLAERVASGDCSPRRCLDAANVERVSCPSPRAIRSVDSPADWPESGLGGPRE